MNILSTIGKLNLVILALGGTILLLGLIYLLILLFVKIIRGDFSSDEQKSVQEKYSSELYQNTIFKLLEDLCEERGMTGDTEFLKRPCYEYSMNEVVKFLIAYFGGKDWKAATTEYLTKNSFGKDVIYDVLQNVESKIDQHKIKLEYKTKQQ